jgi:hypothetical protein
MTDTESRPAMAERYSKALDSSHLELSTERVGDVDVLIAAGLVRDGLGTALYRLVCEFDAVRGDHWQARGNLQDGYARARVLRRDADALDAVAAAAPAGSFNREAAERDAEILRAAAVYALKDASAAAKTAHSIIVSQITNLPAAKAAVAGYACSQAHFQKFHRPDREIVEVSMAALSYWLDPLCHACNGLGHTGGFLTPKVWCTECKHTGRVQVRLGGDNQAHQFGRWLLTSMDAKVNRVSELMKKFLKKYSPERQDFTEATIAALGDRLQELRSAQAQED